MILIDEGWKALDDEVFAARIRDWLKTLSKRNALVGFATQSRARRTRQPIATALVEQTATMIFMPNAKARAEDYCDGFGLTEHELALIRSLPAHSRAFLVRQPDASVVVRLDLSGAPEVLTILSGREITVRRLDLLREAVGDDPGRLVPRADRPRLAGRRPHDDERRIRRPRRRPNERRSLPASGRARSAAALPPACRVSTALPARWLRPPSTACLDPGLAGPGADDLADAVRRAVRFRADYRPQPRRYLFAHPANRSHSASC